MTTPRQSNLLLDDVDIPVFDNLVSTSLSLNTNSPSNNDILPSYQEVDQIAELEPGSGDIFPDNPALLPKISTLESLKQYLSEVMIRFTSNPKHYQQVDFKILIETITNSLFYLYTKDDVTTDPNILSGINFKGVATTTTDPFIEGEIYPGIYFAQGTGTYTSFGLTVTTNESKNSIILFLPVLVDGVFDHYIKQVYSIDVSGKVDKETGKSLIETTKITKLDNIEEGAEVNVIEVVKVNDVEVTITDKTVNIEIPEITVDSALSDTSTNPVQNKVITEQINFIIEAISIAPTYVTPTCSISNISQTVEMGTAIPSLPITITYNQNNGGSATGYKLFWGDTQISTTQNTTVTSTHIPLLANITSAITIKGSVDYAQGAIINNNLGFPDARGRIEAGTVISATRTIQPQYMMFYGATSSVPANSTDVRNLPQSTFSTNSLTLNTGTTYKNFAIAIPSNKSVTSVIDIDSLNAVLTSNYVLTGTLTVLDAGNNNVTYKLYVMTNAIPYTVNKRHVITIA